MTAVHDPYSYYCGATWEFLGLCEDVSGNPLDLTGAAVAWLLDDVADTTNFITLSVGTGITVTNPTGGAILITVSKVLTAALTPGAYRDALRLTMLDGSVDYQWVGAITALAAPK
jgi:hypothetical protein